MNNSSLTTHIKRNAGILVFGVALQLLFGNINTTLLAYPVGPILAMFYVYGLYVVYVLSTSRPALRRLYSIDAMIVALAFLLCLTVLFGLIRQDDAHAPVPFIRLGLTRMSTSWMFCLAMLHFTSLTGLQTIADFAQFSARKALPALVHLCVFVVLTTAIFFAGDKLRVRVVAQEGEPIAMGESDGRAVHLPFSITLQRFSLENYPARLQLFNPLHSVSMPETIVLDTAKNTAQLGQWQLTIHEYYASAIPDSAGGYLQMRHVGAVPAALVTATNSASDQKARGWVSTSSFIAEPATLRLPDDNQLIMPPQQPRNYRSDLLLSRLDGSDSRRYTVEVNHPAHLKSWRIYQVGYDEELGEWSRTSVLECVRDRGYAIIHVGLWLLLVISVLMFAAVRRPKDN